MKLKKSLALLTFSLIALLGISGYANSPTERNIFNEKVKK